MSALVETLVWTGALIALVLVLRRPVARLCGAQCAYALWALPAIRLVLPPLTLPAWMAPQPALPATAPVAAPLVVEAEPLAMVVTPAPAPVAAGFDLFAFIDALPLTEAVLLVWLGGAAVFLWRRFAAYFALRDALLAEAREVGRIRAPLGSIRLIETPGTPAPLAFGVLDPVIALPPGFMALHDRRARDLALAHELAHHRGGDLLINVAVQPLFALHWFNPLGHYGWLALRRDQEAACDARVIAQKSAEERAAYARLIAGFAAGPNLAPKAAIAAPMACPVLGEKSIIQRLRSLSMSHLSLRRRLAGRALLVAGVLALPLTATISYAAGETAQEIPEPPAPPAPPAPPSPPEAPQPPAPPTPPEAPEAFEGADGVEVTERVIRGEDGKEKRVRMVIRRGPDGEKPGDLAAHEAMLADMREELAEAESALAELPRILAEAEAEADGARAAGQSRVIVRHECKPGSKEVSETTTRGGAQVVSICQSRVFASARKGLEEARAEIAADKSIPEDTRKSILDELDRTIARWSDKEG